MNEQDTRFQQTYTVFVPKGKHCPILDI